MGGRRPTLRAPGTRGPAPGAVRLGPGRPPGAAAAPANKHAGGIFGCGRHSRWFGHVPPVMMRDWVQGGRAGRRMSAREDVPDADPQPAEVERWVWSRIAAGERADLQHFPDHDVETRPPTLGEWFVQHLRSKEARGLILENGLRIANARFTAPVAIDFLKTEGHVEFMNCRFEQAVDLANCRIAGALSLERSIFHQDVDVDGGRIGSDFGAPGSVFHKDLSLHGARISDQVACSGIIVGGIFNCDTIIVGMHFFLKKAVIRKIDLRHARIDGQVSFRGSVIFSMWLQMLRVDGEVFLSGRDRD